MLTTWSAGLGQSCTLLAFAIIRDLGVQLPYPFVEHCLKGLYLSFATACRFTNRKTLPHVVLMSSCVVDMCGVDMQATYQHAFVYIRQLAIHLRNAIQQQTEAAYRQVYNWQYVNCEHATLHARTPPLPLPPLLRPPGAHHALVAW